MPKQTTVLKLKKMSTIYYDMLVILRANKFVIVLLKSLLVKFDRLLVRYVKGIFFTMLPYDSMRGGGAQVNFWRHLNLFDYNKYITMLGYMFSNLNQATNKHECLYRKLKLLLYMPFLEHQI